MGSEAEGQVKGEGFVLSDRVGGSQSGTDVTRHRSVSLLVQQPALTLHTLSVPRLTSRGQHGRLVPFFCFQTDVIPSFSGLELFLLVIMLIFFNYVL